MYQKLTNGHYSVFLKNGYFIFNQARGEPFIVTDDLFNRMNNDGLKDEDIKLLNEAKYFDKNDAYEYYEKRIKNYINTYKGPSVLDLIVSESCNLGCHMCIHAFSVENGMPRVIKRAMTFNVAKLWIDYYVDVWSQSYDLDYLSFHFGAAEPFLTKKVFLDCLNYIKNKQTSLYKEILVNSNLTMLDDEILNALVENNVKVSVGLDGLEVENDLIRIDSKGRGTFRKIVKNIKILIDAGIKPGINLTLTDRNFSSVKPKEFLNFMKSLGIDAVLVDIDFVLGINSKPHDILDKLMDFKKIADELQIELRGNWMAPFYNMISENEDLEPKSFCASIRGKNIVVTPSGNLSFCTYSSTSISQITSKDIDKSISNFVEEMKNFMYTNYLKNKESRCSLCPILGLCGGGCHITSEQNGAIELMCEIYKGSTQRLIQYNFGSELI